MRNKQTRQASLTSVGFIAVMMLGCTGEIVEPVTTDYGIAVATTERVDSGDVESFLTSRDGHQLYGEMHWSVETGEAEATVSDAPVTFSGTMEIAEESFELANELLHALWEHDRVGEVGAVCVGNELAICCRDTGWHCRAHP